MDHAVTGRARRAVELVALVVALGVGGWLLATTPPKTAPRSSARPAAPRSSAPPTLANAWPNARVTSYPGRLADGTEYSAWLYLDADTSVGTAPTPDGTATRLLLRTGNAAPRQLRSVPSDHYPQFLGFTSTAGSVYWAESTTTLDGQSETRLWRADVRSTKPPVSLTTDTGSAVFFDSQYDLVVAEGKVHWVAAAPTEPPATELRSVPVGGGRVAVRKIPGMYRLTAWPWLTSTGDRVTSLQLLNLANGRTVDVPMSATELVGCTPNWCRAVVVGPNGGPTRFDLMRPDGSDRHRIAGASATAAVSDVAQLDRFELLSLGDATRQSLLLYDDKTRTTTLIADDVGQVLARGGMLWWSTGEKEAAEWQALDLRTLT
jgi:hypothetical protein